MEQRNRRLIRKYMDGTCTEAERHAVRMLLADPAYQRLFEDMLAENGNPLEADRREPDEQMLRWTAQIQQRVGAPQGPQRRLRRPPVYRYAAVWILALLTLGGLGYLAFRDTGPVPVVYTERWNEGTRPLRVVLADSSVVVIGPGSKLSYPETFAADSREVLLEGEAFFQISKNPARPFIVSSGDICTEVLGTSFKVTAFPGRPAAVAVSTGKVRVSQASDSAAGELALLTPGMQVLYDSGRATTGEISIAQLEGWQNGRLTYRDTPLAVITADMERWYGIRIVYSEEARTDILLNVSLNAEATLTSSLRLLAATGGFTYTVSGQTVTIH